MYVASNRLLRLRHTRYSLSTYDPLPQLLQVGYLVDLPEVVSSGTLASDRLTARIVERHVFDLRNVSGSVMVVPYIVSARATAVLDPQTVRIKDYAALDALRIVGAVAGIAFCSPTSYAGALAYTDADACRSAEPALRTHPCPHCPACMG